MSYEFYNALIISNLQTIKAAFIYIGLLISDPSNYLTKYINSDIEDIVAGAAPNNFIT